MKWKIKYTIKEYLQEDVKINGQQSVFLFAELFWKLFAIFYVYYQIKYKIYDYPQTANQIKNYQPLGFQFIQQLQWLYQNVLKLKQKRLLLKLKLRTQLMARKSQKKLRNLCLIYYKVLRQVHPEIGVSTNAMNIINSFSNDIYDRIVLEASKLVRFNKRRTPSSREIQTAVKLLLPKQLHMHAICEGTKAVTNYKNW